MKVLEQAELSVTASGMRTHPAHESLEPTVSMCGHSRPSSARAAVVRFMPLSRTSKTFPKKGGVHLHIGRVPFWDLPPFEYASLSENYAVPARLPERVIRKGADFDFNRTIE